MAPALVRTYDLLFLTTLVLTFSFETWRSLVSFDLLCLTDFGMKFPVVWLSFMFFSTRRLVVVVPELFLRLVEVGIRSVKLLRSVAPREVP